MEDKTKCPLVSTKIGANLALIQKITVVKRIQIMLITQMNQDQFHYRYISHFIKLELAKNVHKFKKLNYFNTSVYLQHFT